MTARLLQLPFSWELPRPQKYKGLVPIAYSGPGCLLFPWSLWCIILLSNNTHVYIISGWPHLHTRKCTPYRVLGPAPHIRTLSVHEYDKLVANQTQDLTL